MSEDIIYWLTKPLALQLLPRSIPTEHVLPRPVCLDRDIDPDHDLPTAETLLDIHTYVPISPKDIYPLHTSSSSRYRDPISRGNYRHPGLASEGKRWGGYGTSTYPAYIKHVRSGTDITSCGCIDKTINQGGIRNRHAGTRLPDTHLAPYPEADASANACQTQESR